MHRALAALAGALTALMALCAAPLAAQGAGIAPYLALQQRDQKLYAAGWRLATGNAAFCAEVGPALGMVLHDAMAYPDPPAARGALGLRGDIGVQAVAAGSPAERSGITAGATLVAINGQALALAYPVSEPRWQRVTDIDAVIGAVMVRDGGVDLTWLDQAGAPRTRRLAGVPACASRFEVAGIGQRAAADGQRVVFGDRFPGFAWPEEEFAAAVAHELAHNVLQHRVWLARAGRSRSNVRLTEQEADRLTPWLMANAGYDPASAVRFMRRWGPQHDGGVFRRRTHAGWDERADAIAAELPLVNRVRAQRGTADWPRLFQRETGG